MIEGDSIFISKTTFKPNKITQVKTIQLNRHRIIFFLDLSSEEMLKESSKLIENIINGVSKIGLLPKTQIQTLIT